MPTPNPPAVLERLCRESSEAEWLEFKGSACDQSDVGEYISALANGAMLADRDHAYLVFGVADATRDRIGTTIRLKSWKVKGENFEQWVNRQIEPRINIELVDFEHEGKKFGMVVIEPSYHRPVAFAGVEYIRVGENKKRLKDFPERERALWLATSRRKFEQAIALAGVPEDNIHKLLDVNISYSLREKPVPTGQAEIMKELLSEGYIVDSMDGTYSITNMGALLFAFDLTQFPSIAQKRVRVIRYTGTNKMSSDLEQEGVRGYARGFSGIIKFVLDNTPKIESYINGIRRMQPHYPETAIREIVANALIHQDFTLSGTGPMVEIYSDRIEITNPGHSLINVDRILDERRSRNAKLALAMRHLNLCEERGGGLDKAILAIEMLNLPAPAFFSSEDSMRVVLFAPKTFTDMSRIDKERACYMHCVIRWIQNDFMSNSSLRQRFSLPDKDYQAVSTLISAAIKNGRIKAADPNQGNRFARYVPYWA